jgi:chemotaxis family two-component system sensor kinase Cph1
MIYQGPPSRQLPALAAMMRQKLEENYRCLYLNSPPMVSGMRSSLAALGFSIVQEITDGRIVLTSESTLSADGNFDVDLMIHKLEDALDRALEDGYSGLWASGDMTWEFGNRKNLEKLLEYEWRLEELIRQRQTLCGVCQYHHDTLPTEVLRQGLLSHQTIFVNETLSRLNPHYAHSKMLAEEASGNADLDAVVAKLLQSGSSEDI